MPDRRAGTRRLGLALAGVVALCASAVAVARDAGVGEMRVDANGIEIRVFTYRPPGCADPAVLMVFHGLNRKAKGVRRKAQDVAAGACLMVFAPLFDEDRFPNWRYHRAGVVRGGEVQAETQWTVHVLRALIDHARRQVAPGARVYLFGHSAGGQFLSRIAAYSPLPGLARIVVANPSVHVVPRLDEPAPYGFGGVVSGAAGEARLREYLALPITIYVGREDTGDKYLVNNAAARRQGKNRLDRGRRVHEFAQALARDRGWEFGWTLVEAPGVGHSSGGMLRAAALYDALGLQPPESAGGRVTDPVDGLPNGPPGGRPALAHRHRPVLAGVAGI